MYIVARFVEGISLNGYEFLLNDDNELLKFPTVSDAVDFLNTAYNLELKSAEEWSESQNLFIMHESESE
jgi:hypothetical protein